MWVDDISEALRNLGGIGDYVSIYAQVETIRPNLSGNWQATVRRTIQQNSSDTQSWLNKNDIFYSVDGVGEGKWGLRNFIPDINVADTTIQKPNDLTKRTTSQIQRIIRDSYMISQLKLYHKHRCQICGLILQVSENKFYSEGHHIKPMGMPHNGPDEAGNILILCPNCHVKCDYGIIQLDRKMLERSGRLINKEYIDYHNQIIYHF